MIEQALQSFGLNQKEIKVYLSALELGLARVSEIAKKSGIERTNCYSVLEKLVAQGLVLEIGARKRKQFAAEPPEKINLILTNRQKEINKILPELKSIYNLSPKKPKIRFYEGREGYILVYENILEDNPKELLALMSYDDLYHHLDPKYEADWIKRRIEKNIRLRWLVFETEKTKQMRLEGAKSLRQTKFLPPNFSFTGILFIYDNKTIIISGQEKEFTAVVIENAEFYVMFKQFFEMLWRLVGE